MIEKESREDVSIILILLFINNKCYYAFLAQEKEKMYQLICNISSSRKMLILV